MRVLLTADPGIPVPPKLYGGIERIVDGLANELRKRGHQIGLIASNDSKCQVNHFYPWPFTRPNNRSEHFQHLRFLRSTARAWNPDIVHSFSRLGYLVGALGAGFPGIMSYQRYTGGSRIRWLTRLAGRRLAFTACSQFIASMGKDWGGNWHAIPNFVDINLYKYREAVAADAPLVFLSRVERIKGVHHAIAIAKQAGRQLVIAGNHADDGPEGEYWRSEILPQIGRNGVTYIGPVDDAQKNELLGKALALIVPIEWEEPFGIVFIEALACGTPVITCPRGALPEIVRDGVEGFLIKEVADGVCAVSRMGEISRAACRRRVEEAFSAPVVVDQYMRLYTEVTRQARK